MRKQWINEGKPRHNVEDEDDVEPIELVQTRQTYTGQMEGVEMENAPQSEDVRRASPERIDDIAGALPDDGPDEDELDALLAESEVPAASIVRAHVPSKAVTEVDDPFADEMEAMAGMEW